MYLNSFIRSIFLSSYFHSFSSLFLFLLLNTIIFVFSTFTSKLFSQHSLPAFSSSLTFPGSSSFLSFLSHSLPLLPSHPQTPGCKLSLYPPHSSPLVLFLTFRPYLPHKYIVNSRELSGQPCLTPFVGSNHSPSFSPTFALFFVFAYISSIFRSSHSVILVSLSLSYTQTFLSVYLVKRCFDLHLFFRCSSHPRGLSNIVLSQLEAPT
jgi:hypothetical protein